jgi:hypothetical protein
MIVMRKIGILAKYKVPPAALCRLGKISAALLPDSAVTIATAMLCGESNKLSH